MTVGELQKALRQIAELYESNGKKSPFGDFKKFDKLFGGKAELSIEEFLHWTVHEFSRQKARKSTGAKTVVNSDLVSAYVRRLTNAGSNVQLLEVILAELKSDRKISKADLDAIAYKFLGGRDKWPRKELALKAIEYQARERAYQITKAKVVEKARPW